MSNVSLDFFELLKLGFKNFMAKHPAGTAQSTTVNFLKYLEDVEKMADEDLSLVKEFAKLINNDEKEDAFLVELDYTFKSEKMMRALSEALKAGDTKLAEKIEREFRVFYHDEAFKIYELMYDDLTSYEQMEIEQIIKEELDEFIEMYKLATRDDVNGDLTDEEISHFYDLLEERYDVFNDFFPEAPNDEL